LARRRRRDRDAAAVAVAAAVAAVALAYNVDHPRVKVCDGEGEGAVAIAATASRLEAIALCQRASRSAGGGPFRVPAVDDIFYPLGRMEAIYSPHVTIFKRL